MKKFPAPLEGWLVSDKASCELVAMKKTGFRPLSRYEWFPTKTLKV